MSLTELLTKAMYWAAMASLVAMLIGIMLSMLTSSSRWSDLLSNAEAGSPSLARTGFLFGNIGLAVIFLLAVVDFRPDGDGIKRLREATDFFGVLDMSAVSGTASVAYIWSKLTSR